MLSSVELQNLLRRIDHKSYPAYKDTRGSYDFRNYVLSIDHVQGDPFASPSKVSVHIKGAQVGFPKEYYEKRHCRIALQDLLLRHFAKEMEKVSHKAGGSGKSGLMAVSRLGQEILERSACQIAPESGNLTVRFEVGFPANGRTINARELEKILFDFLPKCVAASLFYKALDAKEVQKAIQLAEDQQYIREQLEKEGLCAFVADGSILPRESGVSGRPMKGAVVFQTPDSMKVELDLPNCGTITGMGIKKGITLIVGGGYHGKSTLLKALEAGVYNHIAGDGREYVITDATAVKLRAEDGRSIKKTDISMFINHLPNKKDTVHFYTEDASGSTSQAAVVVEAMEAGAKTFLIDEDTSATNFMIRDELMQRVVNRESEPITPFTHRIRELYENYGISTILVAGSCGSYFEKADCVLQMKQYAPFEITDFAKSEAKAFAAQQTTAQKDETPAAVKPDFCRVVKPDKSFTDPRFKIKTGGLDTISLGRESLDVRYLEQLCDTEQLNYLGILIKYMQCHVFDGKKTLQEAVEAVEKLIGQKGMGAVCEGDTLPCHLAEVRAQELFAAINRFRKLLL